jgi:hypothetical protein
MAKDKEPSQSLTEIAAQSLGEFKDQTQGAVEQYFSLLQSRLAAQVSVPARRHQSVRDKLD